MCPTYPHDCPACSHTWDVVCKVAERDEPYLCPKCQAKGKRAEVVPIRLDSTAGDWNRVEYNPGLGQWTKGWKHARQIAKARGMEEVGTEPVENIHKHFDRKREETREERWREADREKLYD